MMHRKYRMSAHIVINGVNKVFEHRRPRRGRAQGHRLDIPHGQFVCLLGPSGCGKSTLLNAVAGFSLPTLRRITADGKPVTGPGPERGMVFQEYALFPWMTVEQNIAFGLRNQGHVAKAEIRARGRAAGHAVAGGLPQRATRRTCRAACASASRSRACWRWIRRSC
jgi:NitT/TauT family transport system ATP-binding protein